MSRAFAFSIDYVLILLLMTVGLMLVVSGSQQIIEWLSQFSFLQDLFEAFRHDRPIQSLLGDLSGPLAPATTGFGRIGGAADGLAPGIDLVGRSSEDST